jgi:hypothetical protein
MYSRAERVAVSVMSSMLSRRAASCSFRYLPFGGYEGGGRRVGETPWIDVAGRGFWRGERMGP